MEESASDSWFLILVLVRERASARRNLESETNLTQIYMSLNTRKPTMWILTRSDTNQAAQLLEMARSLKF